MSSGHLAATAPALRTSHTPTVPLAPASASRCGASAPQKPAVKIAPRPASWLARSFGASPVTSQSFAFLSVLAVARRPGAAGQKLRAQAGLSWAARRNSGLEPGCRV
jgi:hypothetical protein